MSAQTSSSESGLNLELGVLVGFMLLGIVAFKRTDAQMYREAGELGSLLFGVGGTDVGTYNVAEFLPT